MGEGCGGLVFCFVFKLLIESDESNEYSVCIENGSGMSMWWENY